jgi:hypothetical protein
MLLVAYCVLQCHVLMCTWEADGLLRCTCRISAADDRNPPAPIQWRHVGRHRSACATNSDGTRTSMSFAQKGHLTRVETRAPHDFDLRTAPTPWPVPECTGSVDALPYACLPPSDLKQQGVCRRGPKLVLHPNTLRIYNRSHGRFAPVSGAARHDQTMTAMSLAIKCVRNML